MICIKWGLKITDNISQGKDLTEKVSVCPPIVLLQIFMKVVNEQLLLLFFLHLWNNSDIQVHHERLDLSAFPILPKPPWNVK